MTELYKDAIRVWGIDFQLNMVAEECCELAKACLKFKRTENGSDASDVVEEMADIYIMLEQLKEIVDVKELEGEIIRKKKRLEEMIKKVKEEA